MIEITEQEFIALCEALERGDVLRKAIQQCGFVAPCADPHFASLMAKLSAAFTPKTVTVECIKRPTDECVVLDGCCVAHALPLENSDPPDL